MRDLLRLLAVAVWVLGCALPQLASAQTADKSEKKVALVVGNGAYKRSIDLPNAPNDAREVANSLRRLGFLVVEGIDLSHAGMQDKLREFGRALVGADLGLFFYAGHGLQVSGENYLVPIDAQLKREADLDFEAVKVDAVVRQLSREAKVKVVILDSCRDNPLAQELARSMASSPQSRARSTQVSAGMGAIDVNSVTGTLIAFATAPGMVALDGDGKHSPFTEALLQHLETPDLDIDLMMKRVRGQVVRSTGDRQQPWTNSSLTAEFFLRPTRSSLPQTAALPGQTAVAAPVLAAPIAAAPSGFDPRQIEFELWRAAQQSNTPDDYRAYLSRYPTGTFADIARNRIAALPSAPSEAGSRATTAGPASAALLPVAPAGAAPDIRTADASLTTEKALGLSQPQWREVQRKLTSLGFRVKSTTGAADGPTRTALTGWQRSKELPTTGYLNSLQHAALLVDQRVAAAPSTRGKKAKSAAEPRSRSTAVASKREAPPRQRRANTGGGGGGSSAGGNQAGAALMGAVIGVGAGVALGRAMRRR